MALLHLVLTLCLPFSSVVALQVPTSVERSPSQAFTSQNKMWCAQGLGTIAREALDLYLSLPRSKLYEDSVVQEDTTCEQLGYNYSTGEDPCYLGLQTFHHDEQEEKLFLNTIQTHLSRYASNNQVTLGEADLMDACRCLQGSPVINDIGKKCDGVPNVLARKPQGSFLSANKMWCGQGAEAIAEDALRLYQSMPRGKLYEASVLYEENTCAQLGYSFSTGEDPCFPGLQTFHRKVEDAKQFLDVLQAHLGSYGKELGVTLNEADLIDSCRCPMGSVLKPTFGNSCDKVPKILPHTLQRSFVSANKMWCAQGVGTIAREALDLYLSLPRGKLYEDSVVHEDATCEQLGYNYSTGEDPCYPGLHTFHRNEGEAKQFIDVFQAGLGSYGRELGVTLGEADLIDSCRCAAGSVLRAKLGKSCDQVPKLLGHAS